jgi:hypothetical protein
MEPNFLHVADYLELVEEVLGITDIERDFLKSLLFGHKTGKLIITQYGRNVEAVELDPSMNEREIAFKVLQAFDLLSTKADPSDMAGGLVVRFEEVNSH